MLVKSETLIEHSNSNNELIWVCPKCNSFVSGKWSFCPGCGDELLLKFKGDFMNKPEDE